MEGERGVWLLTCGESRGPLAPTNALGRLPSAPQPVLPVARGLYPLHKHSGQAVWVRV